MQFPWKLGAAMLVAASSASAQIVVNTVPDAAKGVYNTSFAVGAGNAASVAVTTAQPRSGNGSLELRMTNFAQPAVAFAGAPVKGSLNTLSYFGFEYFGTNVANTSPTIRLGFTKGGFSWNLGWYANSGAPNWVNTGNLVDAVGADGFWLRRIGGGSGQVGTDCNTASVSGDFDGRRQGLKQWFSACATSGFDLTDVQIDYVQIDQGRWPGFTGTNVNYVDNMSIQYVDNPMATYNFESNVVPEPSTYALLAAGLAGIVAVHRRRRQRDA